MAKTSIADVIVPEIFTAYVIKQTKELSALIQSGIAVQNDKLDDLVTQGGKLINMPFWVPITGDDEVLSDSAALTPAKITASAGRCRPAYSRQGMERKRACRVPLLAAPLWRLSARRLPVGGRARSRRC